MTGRFEFTHEPHPARVVFGRGSLRRLDEETERLGIARALVVVSPRLATRVEELLGPRSVATITAIAMHVPSKAVGAAIETADHAGADGLLSVGGGSAVGLAKAVGRERTLPILAVPTTYSGSEMTAIWGVTDVAGKRTGLDPRVRPRTVIYDPELTRTMPVEVAGASGLNAVAHAVEALYARDVDPVTQLIAEEAVGAMARWLPSAVDHLADADEADSGALYGAWLAGMSLDRARMGLHHKICHVLGGTFHLPHAPVHAVVLPYVAAFNQAAAPEAMRRLARALWGDDVPASLFALGRRVRAPASLAALGMRREDLERAAEIVTHDAYDNPRPVTRAEVRELLDRAFEGAGVSRR